MIYWLLGKGLLGIASFERSGVFSVLEPPAAAGVVAVAEKRRGECHRRHAGRTFCMRDIPHPQVCQCYVRTAVVLLSTVPYRGMTRAAIGVLTFSGQRSSDWRKASHPEELPTICVIYRFVFVNNTQGNPYTHITGQHIVALFIPHRAKRALVVKSLFG